MSTLSVATWGDGPGSPVVYCTTTKTASKWQNTLTEHFRVISEAAYGSEGCPERLAGISE